RPTHPSRLLLTHLLLQQPAHHPHLPSFPTRRSSDLPFLYQRQTCHQVQPNQATYQKRQKCSLQRTFKKSFTSFSHSTRNKTRDGDRKSGSAGMPRPISYAVFCLKKKKQTTERDAIDLYKQTKTPLRN